MPFNDAVRILAAVTADILVGCGKGETEAFASRDAVDFARCLGGPLAGEEGASEGLEGVICVAMAVRAFLGKGGVGFKFAVDVEIVDLTDFVDRTELTEDGRLGFSGDEVLVVATAGDFRVLGIGRNGVVLGGRDAGATAALDLELSEVADAEPVVAATVVLGIVIDGRGVDLILELSEVTDAELVVADLVRGA